MNLSAPVKHTDYTTYLKSIEWKQKKFEWLDSGRPSCCWVCEEPMSYFNHKGFNFHHKTYANLFNESLDDLVLLCRTHHRDLEAVLKQLKEFGETVENWTWKFIAQERFALGMKPIKDSVIARWIGECNE